MLNETRSKINHIKFVLKRLDIRVKSTGVRIIDWFHGQSVRLLSEQSLPCLLRKSVLRPEKGLLSLSNQDSADVNTV